MGFTQRTGNGRNKVKKGTKTEGVEKFTRRLVARGNASDPVMAMYKGPYWRSSILAKKPRPLQPKVAPPPPEPVAAPAPQPAAQSNVLPRWENDRWLCHCANNNSHSGTKEECKRCGDTRPSKPVEKQKEPYVEQHPEGQFGRWY